MQRLGRLLLGSCLSRSLLWRLRNEIKLIGVTKLCACQVNDLLNVASKVGHRMKDGTDASHIETLNSTVINEVSS